MDIRAWSVSQNEPRSCVKIGGRLTSSGHCFGCRHIAENGFIHFPVVFLDLRGEVGAQNATPCDRLKQRSFSWARCAHLVCNQGVVGRVAQLVGLAVAF